MAAYEGHRSALKEMSRCSKVFAIIAQSTAGSFRGRTLDSEYANYGAFPALSIGADPPSSPSPRHSCSSVFPMTIPNG